MSAMGHKRTLKSGSVTSALPLKGDIARLRQQRPLSVKAAMLELWTLGAERLSPFIWLVRVADAQPTSINTLRD
jgi:hypothetical protein